MKFVSYSNRNGIRPALLDEGWCVDLALAETAYRAGPYDAAPSDSVEKMRQTPTDLKSFISGGEGNLRAALRLRDFARGRRPRASEASDNDDVFQFPVDHIKLHAPIANPYMLAELETNCLEQFEQRGWEPRAYPAMMILPDNVINDPGATVLLPQWVEQVRVSAQIAFVCGCPVNDSASAKRQDAIFGYTLALCFSTSALVRRLGNPVARDISVNEDYGRWFDGFRPYGPFIVTGDEFDLSLSRSLWLTVGSQKQISNTTAMLYSPARVLSTLAEHIPFYPGDIVGLGAMGRDIELPAELPPEGLEVTVEVEGLDKLGTIVRRV